MSIFVRCGSCRRTYKLDDRLGGSTLACEACGGAIAVPGGAGGAMPVADAPAGDPLDDLLALGDAAAAAVATPSAPAWRAAPVRPAPARAKQAVGDDPYVEVPGEGVVDRVVMGVSFGAFAAGVMIPVVLGAAFMLQAPAGSRFDWGRVGRFYGAWAGWVGCFAAMTFGVYAGLAWAGAAVAARLMKFELPRWPYLRFAAAVCGPVAVQFILFAVWFANESHAWPPRAFHWALMGVTFVGLLWLVLRMRARAFAATAGLAVLFAAVLPWLAYRGVMLVTDQSVRYEFGEFRLVSGATVRREEAVTREFEEHVARAKARRATPGG
jgi:hypothetical protein